MMKWNLTRRQFVNATALVGLSSVKASWAQDLLPIRISGDQPIAWLPFFVANERKLWEANGLAPTNVPAATGMSTIISLGAGAAEIGPGSEMPVAIASLNRISVRIIGTFNQVENMELVCSKKIQSASDLLGKKIAIAQSTPSHYYLSLLLKKNGIAANSVSIVRLGPAEMISALGAGAVDGFIWQEPFLSQAVNLDPSKYHRMAEAGLNKIYAVVMASDAAIRDRRPALVKSLKAIDQACAFIKSNPSESLAIGAKYSQMDPALAEAALSKMTFGLEMDVTAVSEKMKKEAEWAVAEGIAKPGASIPDFATLLDDSLFKEARRST